MKNIISFAFVIIFNIPLLSNIEYKVSGKVVFNGNGIQNIVIKCIDIGGQVDLTYKSDDNGNYCFYLNPGIYKLYIKNVTGYISRENYKVITVINKNIENVIFLLEKECKVSGTITLDNLNPISNAVIIVENIRGSNSGRSDSNGQYIVNGVRSSTENLIKYYITGAKTEERRIDNIEEGTEVKLNVVVPSKESFELEIRDKDSREPIKDASIIIVSDCEGIIQSNTNENGKCKFYNISNGNIGYLVVDPFFRFVESTFFFDGKMKKICIELTKLTEKEIENMKYYGMELEN
jgi:hypothetical protein